MKKYLPSLIIVTLIVPSVAFASWWNPISWFNGWSFSNNSDYKTQVLEKRIADLENKLNNNSSTTTIATSTVITATTSITNKVIKKSPAPVDNSANIQAQIKAQVEATLKAKAEQDALIAKQKADAQIQANQATCTAINAEETTLEKNLYDSITYFQSTIYPIFSSRTKDDFVTNYNNLRYAHDSFYRDIEDFKNNDIARVKSQYLDNSYIQSITDNLTNFSNGFENTYESFETDFLIYQNENPYDSYDKNRAIDRATNDYNMQKTNLGLIKSTLDLWHIMPSKYQEARIKYGCTSSIN
ncbi:MAG: hypothetical protein WCG07_00810 [Candidatus Taylorbacteria bacterium]